MSIFKRKSRCGYCHTEGHNRSSCPKMKVNAENGDTWAQLQVERSKTKRCSYCREDGHTKMTCDAKFNDDLSYGWAVWTGLKAAINIISSKKLAKGAFIYGPIQHRWQECPMEITDTVSKTTKPNYEMINFCIEDSCFDERTVLREWGTHFTYTTLAEPADSNVRLRTSYSLPGFFEEVISLDDSFDFGKKAWERKTETYPSDAGRRNSVELCNVLVEAPQEEVDKAVNRLLQMKPLIVDYTDRKTYQSAARVLKKKEKNHEED